MKIMNTATAIETYLRALLYGESGTGKTTSVRTLPLERTLVLMSEQKHLPLMGHDVDMIQIADWVDLQAAFKEIRRGVEGEGLVINERKKDIIVIDSLSEINEQCKRHILQKDRPELLKRQNKKDVGGIYDEQMNQADWGLLITRIESLITAFVHLPCHIIFTCIEKWTEDKMSGAIYTTPALNGQLAKGVARFFDEAYRLEVIEVAKEEGGKEQRRYFRTKRTSRVTAKGSEKLGELEPANWTQVMTKLFSRPKSDKPKESKGKSKGKK